LTELEPDQNTRMFIEKYIRKRLRIRLNKEVFSPSLLLHFQDLQTIFGASEKLLNLLESSGYREPTPIQRQVIPCMLNDMQVLACSMTGSGKTLAFVIPIIIKLLKHRSECLGNNKSLRAVILEPTKELVLQTERVIRSTTVDLDIESYSLTSKVASDSDILTVDIIVATPFSLLSALRQDKVDLSGLSDLVIDEADKMFEEQFLEQVMHFQLSVILLTGIRLTRFFLIARQTVFTNTSFLQLCLTKSRAWLEPLLTILFVLL